MFLIITHTMSIHTAEIPANQSLPPSRSSTKKLKVPVTSKPAARAASHKRKATAADDESDEEEMDAGSENENFEEVNENAGGGSVGSYGDVSADDGEEEEVNTEREESEGEEDDAEDIDDAR